MLLGELKINGTKISLLPSFTNPENKPHWVAANTLTSDYEDITSVEMWDALSDFFIGNQFGLMDWKCIRREINTILQPVMSNSWSKFDQLSDTQKLVACKFFPNKVPMSGFVDTVPNSAKRTEITINFDKHATASRNSRQQVARIYAFSNLPISDCLQLVSEIVENNTLIKYMGGIENLETDGIEGYYDYIQSTPGTSFELTGLAAKNLTILSGITKEQFITGLMSILKDGYY